MAGEVVFGWGSEFQSPWIRFTRNPETWSLAQEIVSIPVDKVHAPKEVEIKIELPEGFNPRG